MRFLEVARSTHYYSQMSKADIEGASNGQGPSAEEKALLDRALDGYHQNQEAGSSWEEVEARLVNRPNQ